MSNKYTTSITSFNGVNFTDNTNSTFMIASENMDSKHYPYLAYSGTEFKGEITDRLVEITDSVEIDGDRYNVLSVKYNNSNGTNQYETVEMLERNGEILPFTMQISKDRQNVQHNRFAKCGTQWLANNYLQIITRDENNEGGIKTLDRNYSFFANYFAQYSKQISGTTYYGFNCNSATSKQLADSYFSNEKYANVIESDSNKAINFVYAYNNVTFPSSLDADEDKDYFVKREHLTYSNVYKVLLTTEDTVPSWITDNNVITFKQFKTDATYNAVDVLMNYRTEYKGTSDNQTRFRYLFLEMGKYEKKADGTVVFTDAKSTNVFFREVRLSSTEIVRGFNGNYNVLLYKPFINGANAINPFKQKEQIAVNLHVGDYVMVDEHTDASDYNKVTNTPYQVLEITDTTILLNCTTSIQTSKNWSLHRVIPKFDYYCAKKNRVYVYSNNVCDVHTRYINGVEDSKFVHLQPKTIYVSALGYPTQFDNYFGNIDSYAVTDSNSDDCTAMLDYNDTVLIMKEKCIEKLLGDMPSNFQTYIYDFCGTMAKFDTIVKINERLYYLGSDYNIYYYSGGEPQKISNVLNGLTPKYKLLNEDVNAEDCGFKRGAKIQKNISHYNTLVHAYGFKRDNHYNLSVVIQYNQIEEINPSFNSKSLLDVCTYKFDTNLNQWFRVSNSAYCYYDDINEYSHYALNYSTDNDNANYLPKSSEYVNLKNATKVVGKQNPYWHAILSPTNLGNLKTKQFKSIRIRYEVFDVPNEWYEKKLNIGYRIDDNEILHTYDVPIEDDTVIEVFVDKMGSELTICLQGWGTIIIKAIEIDYEILENI